MANKNKPAAEADATASTDTEERKPLPVPAGGWPADEFTGKAGRFVRDPFTGVRRPAPPDPADATAA